MSHKTTSDYIPDLYQQYIFKSRYARYIDKESRREEWHETIARYFDFFEEFLASKFNFDFKPFRGTLEAQVLARGVMPSMRGLMTAGPALKRDEAAIFNCSFAPIDNIRSLDEILYTLSLGTGVGFSVETDHVENIPILPDDFYKTSTVVVFEDSRLGWAKGYREYTSLLMNGHIPDYDISKIRPKGTRLKVFGGRASGPGPLVELLEFTKNIFVKAAGRKLSTIECHDLACKVADVIVSGGVRRSALISLSDLTDNKMRDAKSGNWWLTTPHRRLSNNSAVYNEKPDFSVFMREWLSLYESKSGERGIFSRAAVKRVIEAANQFRKEHFGDDARQRDTNYQFGSNPCSEIVLRPYEFCNLTSVQIYPHDTPETLKEKVRVATILGTIQSCLTNFKYLNKKWQRNCEDERLLGISLNGVYGNKHTNSAHGKTALIKLLEEMRKEAIATNIEWAKKLGINSSVGITCVKPEGTTSALNGITSGLHPAHSKYYIRYVRNDIKDPLTDFMKAQGVPWEVDNYDPSNVVCFKFPIKALPDAVTRKDITAIQHLELWKIYQMHWCEHKPSVTISVKEEEWFDVGAWCFKNFEWLSGVSFLPATDHVYTQAPFTECDKETYNELVEQMPPDIDWRQLSEFETEDSTTNTQELSCTAGTCHLI